jgi:hypothetical protein
MALRTKLPSRFPVGTKFVIEGRRRAEGQVQIYSRYLEMPNGRCIPLPAQPPQRRVRARRRRSI